MNLAMVANITFPANSRRPAFSIRRIHSARAEGGYDRLTDIAEIKLPRNVSDLKQQQLKKLLQRGDEVIIDTGYDGKYQREFAGYVSEVSADIPVMIKCEDEMFHLKQGIVSISQEDATLKSILAELVPGYTIDAADIALGDYLKENTTVAKVLEDLKDTWGIYTWFEGKTLISGKLFQNARGRAKFHLEKNVRPEGNSLKYQLADAMLLQVKATSKLPDGENIDVTVGDPNGQTINKTFYNVAEKDLKALAEMELNRLKVDGYRGSLDSYGIPYVRHQFIVDVESDIYVERKSSNWVKGTVMHFSPGTGIKRSVILDRVANG